MKESQVKRLLRRASSEIQPLSGMFRDEKLAAQMLLEILERHAHIIEFITENEDNSHELVEFTIQVKNP